MLVPFLILLREGLEAALVVGIIASYLSQTGRGAWLPAVWVGVLLALAAALFAGAGLQWASAEFPQRQQELFEAAVGLAATALLTAMVFWMRQAARSLRQELHRALDARLAAPQHQAYALIAMVFLAVAREGLETVFFLLAVFQQSDGPAAPLGALLGLAVAVALGYGLYTGGIRLNLARFFRITGVLILFVAAGLLAQAVRALHEAGVWNSGQRALFDLNPLLPEDGVPGTLLGGLFGYQAMPTPSTLGAYLLYLVVTLALFFRSPRATAPSATPTPSQTPSQAAAPAAPALRGALLGALVLTLLALALFYQAARTAAVRHQALHGAAVTVEILADRCEPVHLSVPAGKTVFRIVNRSPHAVEWEILDGVLVVEERENIAPGLSQLLSATLAPGQYAMTCGLLSNPHGTLDVLADAAVAAAPPALVAFVGPLSEYRVYLNLQSRDLLRGLTALRQTLVAGNLGAARQAYGAAWLPYQRLAALSLAPQALAPRFRRLAQELFVEGDLAGADVDLAALATEATRLRETLLAQPLLPERPSADAARALEALAGDDQASTQDDPGLWTRPGLGARLDSLRKVTDLLKPLVRPADPALQQRLNDALAAFAATVGETAQRPLSAAERATLVQAARTLATSLAQVAPALGLDPTPPHP